MNTLKLLISLCFLTVVATAQDKQFVENKENGQVNWSEQFIEASGKSFIDTERWKILKYYKQ